MKTTDDFPRVMDRRLFLSVLAAGLLSFTGVVIETAMNVTFPTLMKEFSVSISTVQWITTGYLLMLSLVIPASAFLKKRFSAKRIFITANLIFSAGTIMGYWSPSFSVLLLGRLLQGAGTGLALPLMFNIVMEQAPLEKIGFMMGAATLTIAMAPAIGPSVGGWIVQDFGWRMIFVALLPVLVFSLACGASSIRQSSVIQKTKFPLLTYLWLAVGFSCFILASSFAGEWGWSDVRVLGLFAVSIACLFVFARISVYDLQPLIHLQVFCIPAFSLCVSGLLLLQFICLGLGFLIPNYAQIVLTENAFVSGCILLPGCLLGALLAPVSGKLLDRFGARRPLMAGCAFVCLAMTGFHLTLSEASVPLMAAIYAIFTLGQGFTSGNTLVAGLSALPAELKADGNAVFNTLQQLAGAIGTAIVAAVVSMPRSQFPDNLEAATAMGSHYAFMLLLGLAVLQWLCLGRAVRNSTKNNKKEKLSISY